MRDLRLNGLRAYAAVYRHGGVRAAASHLGVSHSSVSRHIKELEAWIGITLFSEGGGRKRIGFTAQGEALGKASAEAIESLEQTITMLKESRRSNSVVISTTASVAVRWLIPRLAHLEKAHRSIEVSVLTEQAISDPQRQGADIGIRMGRGPWADVESEPLMSDALYPVMHPKLYEQLKSSRKKNPFAKYPLIHDRDPSAAWNEWFQKYPNDCVDLRRGLRYSSSDLVLRAAAQQIGIALARDRLVADDIRSGLLMRPFGEYSIEIDNAYWIVTTKNIRARSAVAAVIDWLKSEGGNGIFEL